MKVIIVHGWHGWISGHWVEWLRDQLKDKKIEVYLPLLPNPALEKEWLSELKKITNYDSNTILVGHSLGCAAILRLLEELPETQKVGKVVFVVGWVGGDHSIPELRDFYKKSFDWKKIQKQAEKFIVINSDNDPYYEKEKGREHISKYLKSEFILEHNQGHINVQSGFGPYPKLLKMALEK
ncbi:MAG: alpha/beta hydrolase [Candidatus Diapherotrites archaeon]|nr:alpha/beta hydrolase [Candidatus Diapherotrites archaeon]